MFMLIWEGTSKICQRFGECAKGWFEEIVKIRVVGQGLTWMFVDWFRG